MSFKATLQPPALDSAVVGTFVAPAANPTAFITRSNNTTAYAANQIVSSPTTAIYPALQVARRLGAPVVIRRLRIRTNLGTTSLAGVAFNTRLWERQPIYTNADGGAYAVTNGFGSRIGKFQGTWENEGEYSYCDMSPLVGYEVTYVGQSSLFWDMQTLAAFTPVALQRFDMVFEDWLG